MSNKANPFTNCLALFQKNLAAGHATEGPHCTTMKTLLGSLSDGIVAIDRPCRIKCGAPDFSVTKDSTTIGCVEAKDIGESLDEAEKSPQLVR